MCRNSRVSRFQHRCEEATTYHLSNETHGIPNACAQQFGSHTKADLAYRCARRSVAKACAKLSQPGAGDPCRHPQHNVIHHHGLPTFVRPTAPPRARKLATTNETASAIESPICKPAPTIICYFVETCRTRVRSKAQNNTVMSSLAASVAGNALVVGFRLPEF